MGRAEAASRKYGLPARVANRFQVSRYKVEPVNASRACNLLPKDNARAALTDEPVERGPQVPLVSKPAAFACRAERLAGAGPCPDGALFWPTGKAQREGPASNSGEEMALVKPDKVAWQNIFDAPIVNFAVWQLASFHQFSQMSAAISVYFIVICFHRLPFKTFMASE
jgi:hypothetical protein